jgi:hypothetical protein
LAKNGSFGFAKRWLLCRAKPNVSFVRLVFWSFFCRFNVALSVVLGLPLTNGYAQLTQTNPIPKKQKNI